MWFIQDLKPYFPNLKAILLLRCSVSEDWPLFFKDLAQDCIHRDLHVYIRMFLCSCSEDTCGSLGKSFPGGFL